MYGIKIQDIVHMSWCLLDCRNAATKNRNLSKVQNSSPEVKYCFNIAHPLYTVTWFSTWTDRQAVLWIALTWNRGDCRRYFMMNTAENILYLKHWILTCCEIKDLWRKSLSTVTLYVHLWKQTEQLYVFSNVHLQYYCKNIQSVHLWRWSTHE